MVGTIIVSILKMKKFIHLERVDNWKVIFIICLIFLNFHFITRKRHQNLKPWLFDHQSPKFQNKCPKGRCVYIKYIYKGEPKKAFIKNYEFLLTCLNFCYFQSPLCWIKYTH